ncbi:hypothetical protein AK830_g8956 [Neonectria ditissima]|uniref:Uncharacterized protein n=1 Tax=Neonectria ditissima TaxID=78410 RepID=A0A0N8H600_9HYPO|nr:hypothetical protein AK830_g8956 [Neonectria ditissima]
MSDRFKNMMDKGKEKGKELRAVKPKGTIRGSVTGLVHRTKSSEDEVGHVARPISQLRDPASFAPPPKRTGSGLAPAPPPTSTPRHVVTAPSKYQDPRAPKVEPPVYQKQPHDPYQQQGGEQEEEDDRPPQPYRANTTGLEVAHLPAPPGRRDGAGGRAPPPLPPPSYQSATSGSKPGPPGLPPRLPPRTNSGSSTATPPAVSPASTGNSFTNQGAVSRLGAAGISVPAFGIGRSSPANQSSPAQPPQPGAAPPAPSHMNELQNRFSKLGGTASAPPNPPGEGTTWAQKQAAMKTASSFHKDPSSVSFSDVKSAAGTANNFRQRHGEQVAAGAKTANGLNQKYGLMDKVGSYTGSHNTHEPTAGAVAASPSVPTLLAKKKPPPPPPKKKPGLGNTMTASDAPAVDGPPPIPMATRPQF